jgi:hypothetical protein
MQLELRPNIIDRLTSMPESGMGYQVVDLILVDGRIVPNVVVFNSEIANLPDEFRDLRSSDVTDVQPPQSAQFGR